VTIIILHEKDGSEIFRWDADRADLPPIGTKLFFDGCPIKSGCITHTYSNDFLCLAIVSEK